MAPKYYDTLAIAVFQDVHTTLPIYAISNYKVKKE